MTNASSEHYFGISDNEFYTEPFRHENAVIERAFTEKPMGLRIDAPSRVEIDRRATLPVIGSLLLTQRDEASLSFSRAAIAVATDLKTNRTLVAPAVSPDLVPDPVPPGPDPGEGLSVQLFTVELRERLELTWSRRAYSIRMLLREWASNSVRVELVRSPTAFRDSEVEALIAQHQPPQLGVWPPRLSVMPDALPSYERTALSPALPDGAGLALAVPRVTVLTDGARCALRGSFRLPVRAHERLIHDHPLDSGASAVTAIVPVTLVLTGAQYPVPIVLRLRVPTHDQLDDARPLATGYFAVDLLALAPALRRSQTYFLSAFSGETGAGPLPLAFVAPGDLE